MFQVIALIKKKMIREGEKKSSHIVEKSKKICLIQPSAKRHTENALTV